ncbi:MAG: hypothetical protein QXS02_05900 [Candidatus Thermoplasmatota archaeon]
MDQLHHITEQIKILKQAKDILKHYYETSEFHKKKERNPQEVIPPSPEDEDIYKLLTAIQQIDFHIKKLQDEQFMIIKKQDEQK